MQYAGDPGNVCLLLGSNIFLLLSIHMGPCQFMALHEPNQGLLKLCFK